MAAPLVIKVKLDRSEAKAGAKAHADDMKAMTESSDQQVKAQKRGIGEALAERINAAKAATSAEQAAFGQTSRGANAASTAIKGVGGSVASLAASFGALTVGNKVFGEITGAASAFLGVLHAANQEAEKQVDKLLATKDLIRDIAGMTGSKGGSTDAEVGKHLGLRVASGLSDAAAKSFSLEFSGAGEAKKGINISPEEFKKAKPLVARFAAANTSGDPGSAGTYGELAGLLLGFKKDQTAKGLVGDLAGFNKILSLGVGDNPTLVRESAEQAGAVLNSEGTGIVKSPNELAALIATASMKSPKSAGNTILQSVRALRSFDGPQGEFLKSAGMAPTDDLVTSFGKLFKELEAAEKAGKPIDSFLGEKGFHGTEDKFALQTMYNYRSYMGRFLDEGKNAPTPDQAMADIDQKYKGDVALQAHVQEAKLDEAKMGNAMALQHARPLELEARTRLQKRGEGDDSGWAKSGDWWTGLFNSVGGLTLPDGMTREQLGRKMRVEQEMFAIAQERGFDKLVQRPDINSPLGGYSGDYMAFLTTGQMEQSYSQAAATAGMGGKPTTEIERRLKENTDALNLNTAALKPGVPKPDPSPTTPPSRHRPGVRPLTDRP